MNGKWKLQDPAGVNFLLANRPALFWPGCVRYHLRYSYGQRDNATVGANNA